MPLQSVFANYSVLVSHVPAIDEAHVLQIAIMEVLFFSRVIFMVAYGDGAFISNNADLRIVAYDLEVLVPMLDRLTR